MTGVCVWKRLTTCGYFDLQGGNYSCLCREATDLRIGDDTALGLGRRERKMEQRSATNGKSFERLFCYAPKLKAGSVSQRFESQSRCCSFILGALPGRIEELLIPLSRVSGSKRSSHHSRQPSTWMAGPSGVYHSLFCERLICA
jgi:hypothetical protein